MQYYVTKGRTMGKVKQLQIDRESNLHKKFPYMVAYAVHKSFHESKLNKMLALADLHNLPKTTTYLSTAGDKIVSVFDYSELTLERSRQFVSFYVKENFNEVANV